MGAGEEIIVGVDGSLSGWAALRWAAGEAELRHARLVVLHCARVSLETAWRGGPLDLLPSDYTGFEREILDSAPTRIRPLNPS